MPFGTTWSLQVVKKVSQEVSRKRVKIQKAYGPFWEGVGGCPGRGGRGKPLQAWRVWS